MRDLDDRRLNIFQLLALALVTGVGGGIATLIAGGGLLAAALVAWSGTIVGALAITAGLTFWDAVRHRPSLVQARDENEESLSALIDAWNEDLSRDRSVSAAMWQRPGWETDGEPEILPASRLRDVGKQA